MSSFIIKFQEPHKMLPRQKHFLQDNSCLLNIIKVWLPQSPWGADTQRKKNTSLIASQVPTGSKLPTPFPGKTKYIWAKGTLMIIRRHPLASIFCLARDESGFQMPPESRSSSSRVQLHPGRRWTSGQHPIENPQPKSSSYISISKRWLREGS